ncbi:MAG: hypothetical protein AAGA85_05000 [Bacteroidota bacterium]
MKGKVQPRYFDGFKYLRLSDLPPQQATLFSGWTSLTAHSQVPKDVFSEKQDIVRYEDYDFWFDYHYLTDKDMDELL